MYLHGFPDLRYALAIGMKAMILFNLSTKADIANSTRGAIINIILDLREGLLEPDEEEAIKLTYPVALILFELDGSSQILSSFQARGVQKFNHAIGLVNFLKAT